MSFGDVIAAIIASVMILAMILAPVQTTNALVGLILRITQFFGVATSPIRKFKTSNTVKRNWLTMRPVSADTTNSISGETTEVPQSPEPEIRMDLRSILDKWKSEESAGVLSPTIATEIAETMTAAQFIEWANYVGDEIVRLTRVFHKLSPEKFTEMWQLQPNFASNWILAENYIERLKTTYLKNTGVRT